VFDEEITRIMKIPIYQVDAFTSEVFLGNPAAVCILDSWIDDNILQSIAAENNLSETAFLVRMTMGLISDGSLQRLKLRFAGTQHWRAPLSFSSAKIGWERKSASVREKADNSSLVNAMVSLRWISHPDPSIARLHRLV